MKNSHCRWDLWLGQFWVLQKFSRTQKGWGRSFFSWQPGEMQAAWRNNISPGESNYNPHLRWDQGYKTVMTPCFPVPSQPHFALTWHQRRANILALSQPSCELNSVELWDAEEKPTLQSLHPEQQRGMRGVQSIQWEDVILVCPRSWQVAGVREVSCFSRKRFSQSQGGQWKARDRAWISWNSGWGGEDCRAGWGMKGRRVMEM